MFTVGDKDFSPCDGGAVVSVVALLARVSSSMMSLSCITLVSSFVFGRSRVQISDRRPAISTEGFRSFL
jgi:hypothetical protein